MGPPLFILLAVELLNIKYQIPWDVKTLALCHFEALNS